MAMRCEESQVAQATDAIICNDRISRKFDLFPYPSLRLNGKPDELARRLYFHVPIRYPVEDDTVFASSNRLANMGRDQKEVENRTRGGIGNRYSVFHHASRNHQLMNQTLPIDLG